MRSKPKTLTHTPWAGMLARISMSRHHVRLPTDFLLGYGARAFPRAWTNTLPDAAALAA